MISRTARSAVPPPPSANAMLTSLVHRAPFLDDVDGFLSVDLNCSNGVGLRHCRCHPALPIVIGLLSLARAQEEANHRMCHGARSRAVIERSLRIALVSCNRVERMMPVTVAVAVAVP
jgi:hypothetical protein